MSKTNIYILRCEGGKYYVGKSDNPMARYKEHLMGNGSAWTKQHRPVEVVKIIPDCSSFDEDKYTKEYMAKYGIDNVRGGIYATLKLDDFQRETITQEIRAAQDKCIRCGRSGHFVKDCFAILDVNGYEIDCDSECDMWACEKCDKEFDSYNKCATHEKYCKQKSQHDSCFRCGRQGHYSSDCYASRHIRGYDI